MRQLLLAIEEEFRGEVRREEPMIGHSRWRVGGPAELFLIPADAADLQILLAILKRFRVPWIVVGHGNHLLVRDGGIKGAVISLECFDAVELKILSRIEAGAGLSIAELIRRAAENGLCGLEALSEHWRGTVGGVLMMSAADEEAGPAALVERLTLVDAEGSRELEHGEFVSGLTDLDGQRAVTSVLFRLKKADGLLPGTEPGGRQDDRAVSSRDIPVFRDPSGQSAGQLIEAAGLGGERLGDAEISTAYGSQIVNLGQATAEDILGLIDLAQHRVSELSGVDLELNVRVVGQGVQVV